MSKVAELVEQEATKAEAENPDEPQTDEPTPEEQEEDETPPEAEPEAEPAVEPPNTEAMLKAVESEMTRHEKAFAKAIGVPIEALNVCAHCQGAGFTEESEPDIKEATFAEACPDCNGYGKVISGSLNENTRLIDCRRCQGYGYVNVLEEVTAPAPVIAHETPAPPVALDPAVADLVAKGYTVLPPYQAAQ